MNEIEKIDTDHESAIRDASQDCNEDLRIDSTPQEVLAAIFAAVDESDGCEEE